jgi:hypothetical protein
MTSPFETLPRELRFEILNYAIEPLAVSFCVIAKNRADNPLSPPVTRVSHTIRTDALTVLFEKSTWIVEYRPIGGTELAEKAVRKLGPAFARSVRHIVLKGRKVWSLPGHSARSVWNRKATINLVEKERGRQLVRGWWRGEWLWDSWSPILSKQKPTKYWRDGDKLTRREKSYFDEFVKKRVEGLLRMEDLLEFVNVDWLRMRDALKQKFPDRKGKTTKQKSDSSSFDKSELGDDLDKVRW